MPDLHLSTGAYALDALDELERRSFERHLRDCPECGAEVTEFHEATTMLADRVTATPPAGMRAVVLREIARTRQVPPGREPRGKLSWRWVLTAAAAVVIAAGAAGGGVAFQGHRAEQTAQTQAAVVARVLSDPSAVRAQGAARDGGNASVVVSRGRAVFTADALPGLTGDRVYQLWVISDPQNIRSAGLFTLKDGSGQALVDNVPAGASVAVSVEPDGGSQQPTTDPIVNLQAI